MKNLEQIRSRNWAVKKARELQAALNVELDAAQDYYERMGIPFATLDPVAKRKVIENFKEDHQ